MAKSKRRKPLTAAGVRKIIMSYPGMEEGPCYGTPGFRVHKKFVTRLHQDGKSLVMKCPFEEREFLMNADPRTFYITDHYRNWPAVLISIERVDEPTLRRMLEGTWRKAAPKTMVKAFDASRSPAAPAPRRKASRPVSRTRAPRKAKARA